LRVGSLASLSIKDITEMEGRGEELGIAVRKREKNNDVAVVVIFSWRLNLMVARDWI
jgi:hypothetical protein